MFDKPQSLEGVRKVRDDTLRDIERVCLRRVGVVLDLLTRFFAAEKEIRALPRARSELRVVEETVFNAFLERQGVRWEVRK